MTSGISIFTILCLSSRHASVDRNAIQVKNIAGQQVGHIPRIIACDLAPLLDQQLVTVEGVIHTGNCESFHITVASFGFTSFNVVFGFSYSLKM